MSRFVGSAEGSLEGVPVLTPLPDETAEQFIQRFLTSPDMIRLFPKEAERLARAKKVLAGE